MHYRCPLEEEVVGDADLSEEGHKGRAEALGGPEELDADRLGLLLLAPKEGEGDILSVAACGRISSGFQNAPDGFLGYLLMGEMTDRTPAAHGLKHHLTVKR